MSNGDHAAPPAADNDSPQAVHPQSSLMTPEADSGTASETQEAAPSQLAPQADANPGRADASPRPAPLARLTRGGGPLAARGLGVARPASPSVDPQSIGQAASAQPAGKKPKPKKKHPRPRVAGDQPDKPKALPQEATAGRKVAVPNTRLSLPDDIQAELDAELAAADVEAMLSGSAGMPNRSAPLEEGSRVHGQVLKIHDDGVFVSLGGPDEGIVPLVQFKQEPTLGSAVEVIVHGISREDGLYALSLPGETIDVSDWGDLEEGSVVDATVTGSNAGGLECKVGGVKAFIPISQISEYRVEDTSEFIGQKLLCVVTEASQRRGNLVLSRRAVLEREREEKRKQQLEKIEPGDQLEGIVRSIKDFGAFVDLGGLDGLIHISKLSWDRVKHPSEVLEVGQKVTVKIDKVDKETGKISLSYRDLLANPWDHAAQEFAIGSVHRGTVTRVAGFGCFVRLAAGVEGLVHVSELANHRVSKVDAFVHEGQEVDVKVLSFDREAQKIGLSIKAAQQAGVDESAIAELPEETIETPREPVVKAARSGPLKGGNNRETGGERFGLRW
jgi:small subunit ribosomal protein S1